MFLQAAPSLVLFSLFALQLAVNAKPANKDTGKCQFENYDETHELKSVERIRPLIGKKYTSHDEDHGYVFTVGICADLGQGDAGVIQIEKKKPEDTEEPKPRNIGSLKFSHLMAGSNWALLEYKEGENDNKQCGSQGKRTAIMLSCDEDVGDYDAKMVYIEEERLKTQDCYYLFEMKHKAVCPVTLSTSTLSIGSILVIVFFSVLIVYLLVGFVYSRFVLGSKGFEQIPNYEFWKDFGNLQADGCDLVCRTKERRNVGFRGIGDEQLDPAEEQRDDNLLPM